MTQPQETGSITDDRWDRLVQEHDRATKVCSSWHHARKASPVIDELRDGALQAGSVRVHGSEASG